MAKIKPKRSYTTTTLDSSGYIEGGGVRALPHNLWVDIKYNKVLYVCLTFILAFFVIFSFLPLVGLLMAFERYSPVKGFFGSQWVGLQNFETFFSGPYVGRLIRNTLAIGVLNLVVNFPAPIIFALILNEIKNKYFKKIVQTISYMPYFVSAVVACGIVVDFTEAGGAISTFVASITGSEPQNLLNQGTNFWLIYVLQNMWQGLGYGSIIYISALSAIDQELYEAAAIDGAGKWLQCIHVTIPGILPMIIMMLIMQMGSVFSVGADKILLIRQARVIFRQAVITESRQFASFSRSLACTRKRKTLCTAARAAWCMTASFAASCFTTVRSRRCFTFGSTQMKALLTSTLPR